MPHIPWRARSAALTIASLTATLVTLLAGCSSGGAPTVNNAGPPLPAVIVSSIDQAQASGGFLTLHIEALDPTTGSARWTYQTEFSPLRDHRAPVVAGGTIFVNSDALPATPATDELPVGALTALSERDGHTIWTDHLGALGSAPVVSDGVVYTSGVTSINAGRMSITFYALRADTGRTIWRTVITTSDSAGAPSSQGFGVANALQVADGVVYIASNPFCFDTCGPAWLLALRASDGKRLWKTMASDAGTIRAPAVANGAVYTVITSAPNGASLDPLTSQLAAYSASDGAPRWKVPMTVAGLLTVANGLLYTTSITQDQPPSSPNPTFSMRLNALDPASGATRWSVTTSTGDTDSYLPLLAMTPSALYVQSITHSGYTLTSLDPASGAPRWRAPLGMLLGLTFMDGETLYAITSFIQGGSVTARNASLIAYSASDGHQLWSTPPLSGSPPGAVEATLANAGGVIVATFLSDTLSAYDTQGDHRRVWQATPPGVLIGLTAVG